MNITHKILLISLCLLSTACGGDKPSPELVNEAPVLVASTPENGAKDITGSSIDIKLSYDQNVKCLTRNHASISVNGGAEVTKVNAYMQDVTISVGGLKEGNTYVLNVPDGVIEGYKENQEGAKGVSITFSTKEAAQEQHYELSPVAALSDDKATRQAQNVYAFLLEQSGRKMLSGVQSEGTANNNEHVNLIYAKTGKHPAVAGYDFIFLQYSPTPAGWSWVVNYGDMSAPIEHWSEGGLVNYMWHWNVPNSKSDWEKGVNEGNFEGYNFYSDKSSFSISQALTEGTWQNDFIMKDMEKVAGYLKILQDAGVPVIWRPLHEAAGNYNLYGTKNNAWFWWGREGAENCKKLYRLMRDTFEQKYDLHNLIWVWTLDATQGAEAEWADWYPGDEYVDIVGVDIYEDNVNAKTRQYQACVDLTKGRKLVTVSECGNIPDPEKCFEAGNKWSWFLVWSSGTKDYSFNTDSYWKQLMASDKVMTRESMPSLK